MCFSIVFAATDSIDIEVAPFLSSEVEVAVADVLSIVAVVFDFDFVLFEDVTVDDEADADASADGVT